MSIRTSNTVPARWHLLDRAGMMRVSISLPIILFMSVPVAYGRALPSQPVPHSRDLGEAADGISGIVVNQTLTQNGFEFYRIFSLLWSENPDARNYSLDVKEQLSKRYGNKINIYIGQKLLYSSPLSRKYDGLFEQCQQALQETQTNLISMAMQTSDGKDIIREEM